MFHHFAVPGCPGRSQRERTDHMSDNHLMGKPLLISAGQLVDGRGGAPGADPGGLVDAPRMISWAGPMAPAPPPPDEIQRGAPPGPPVPGFLHTHPHFAVP